jgi:capsular exopolysaccharide synthesis family protein
LVTTTTGRGRYDVDAPQPLQLKDYLDVLRRRVWMVVIAAVVGGGLATWYATSQADEYVSTASVLINPIEVDLSATNLRSDQLVNMFTQREVVRSASLAAEVSARVEGNPAVELLQQNLTLVVVEDTQVLRISYAAGSAARAQVIAQAFADVYLERRDAQATTEVERRSGDLELQLEDVRTALQDASIRLAAEEEGSIAYNIALNDVNLLTSQAAQINTALTDIRRLAVDGGSVISPAFLPKGPVNLAAWLLGAAGVFAGAVVGIPLAFARDSLDDRIRSDADLERAIGRPVLGSVPGFGVWLNTEAEERAPTILQLPDSPASEAFRRLRSTLLAVARDEAVSSILVTSAVDGEGAPNVAVNLAIAFAQAGTDTLLISANFRDSRVDDLLGVGAARGLGEVLLGKAKAPDVARYVPGVPDTLRVIASGADLENPADALDSPVVEKVVGGFDVPFEMLIVEAPPVTVAADALSLAQLTGGVVLCVRSWSSYLSTVDDAMNQLTHVRANVLGIMMT